MNEIEIKPEKTLEIDKKTFNGFINIKNTSNIRKAFKIKTTKPEDFIVKKSIGILHPDESIKIVISVNSNIILTKNHRFAIEIYDLNWRQTTDTLKGYLKSTGVAPSSVRQLYTAYGLIQNYTNNLQTEIIEYGFHEYCSIFIIAIILFILFCKMLQPVDT